MNSEEAVKLLREVVQESGELHVDPNSSTVAGCKYVQGNAPMCIVARVLVKYGVPIELLRDWDAKPNNTIDRMYTDLRIPGGITPNAAEVLFAAQDNQDRGYTWGTAVDRAAAVQQKIRSFNVRH